MMHMQRQTRRAKPMIRNATDTTSMIGSGTVIRRLSAVAAVALSRRKTISADCGAVSR
jgi:hypothetical protein